MTADEIRKIFLDFFASKGHTIVTSDSLVPKNDPTVLFTTAGMQQFKRQFLGEIGDYTRAASSQKCLRTDDLEKVGRTDFHHTFFEMLGNFSFGDYFKEEAISWAWEFLTKELKIPEEKLWVSVYKEDKEAKEIWLRHINIDPQRLVELGGKSNFWPSEAKEKGPNGPCGPCSEIFFDYGRNPRCTNASCDPGCDCGRFSEVWNLVFTQFNRKEGGVLEPLPHKNIDTGMGLERLTAVVQGKKSNYDTDLFVPILKAVEHELQKVKLVLEKTQEYIMADHIRAIVFAISDGVIPSNKERGFVIKRLITDSTDIILRNHGHPFIHKLVPAVVEVMGETYPEIKKKAETAVLYINKIEEDHSKVHKTRIPELTMDVKSVLAFEKKERVEELGRLCFKYRDTHGLTLETIFLVMLKAGMPEHDRLEVKKVFDQLMNEQREQSRVTSKMTGDVFTAVKFKIDVPKTQFLGYEHMEAKSKVIKILVNEEEVKEAPMGSHVKIILDQTPFYAEGGGQIGDSGVLTKSKGKIRIQDVHKIDEIFIHLGVIEEGSFKVSDHVQALVDTKRRLCIMRNHTATHLLQAALREILGSHIEQHGSLVAQDRLRFDFTHPKALGPEEILKIEKKVNEFILACDPLKKEYMPIEKARHSGALAFFAEKYGNIVRVVSIGNYSKEFCGGTHLGSTGQIGLFKIVNETAIAQGVRRLEAKTGEGALEYVLEEEKKLQEISKLIKAPANEIVERVKDQALKFKELEKDLEEVNFGIIKNSIDTVIQGAESLNGTYLISHTFKDVDMEVLRKVSDMIKQKCSSAVMILGARTIEHACLLIAVSDDLVRKGIKANEMIKDIAPLIGGSGGGRPQLAQAGSKEIDKVEAAVQKARQIIKERIKL